MTQNKEFVSLFCDNEDIKARFQFSKAYILEIMFHTMNFEAIFVWRNEKNWFTMENREI
jgi:hypothetical protein